jgi:predicted TIM-barrel fold metal-dependent hydrolase
MTTFMKHPLLLVALPLALMLSVLGIAVQQSRRQARQVQPGAAEGPGAGLQLPDIREYKPRSTLVSPQHPVARSKFPVIDIHSHHPTPISPVGYAEVVKAMDDLNLRLVVNLSGGWGDRLRQGLAAIKASPYPDRMVLFANIDFRDVGPGFGTRAARQLEEDIRAGAKGLKVFKQLGLWDRRTDGTRLKMDDPELDPIWDTCARLNVPVVIHTADPAEFFQPIDYRNERFLELALFPARRYQDRSRFPAFEELMKERDQLFARHPATNFIVAHMGWHANDLARLGTMMDRMPNIYADVAAVLYDIGRQPRAAHEFFIKHQDRLLFGKDTFEADEYRYYWRVFETADEYFDYYRDYHAFWKLYGTDLPDSVLKKLYYANALKITPGLPQQGFTDLSSQ